MTAAMPGDDETLEPQEGFTGPPRSPFEVADEAEMTDPPFARQASAPVVTAPRSAFRDGRPTPVLPPTRPPRPGDSYADDPRPAKPTTPVTPPGPTAAASAAPTSEGGASPAAATPASLPDSRRQLELRAIFSVGHVMSHEEILEHAAKLPGVDRVDRVDAAEATGLDALRRWVSRFGLSSDEPVGLLQGGTQLEFFQEGEVVLLARSQTGLGPGVREALILVARELGRGT